MRRDFVDRRIGDKVRHVRWNCHQSPSDSEQLRYFLVVVDNKNRERTMEKIVEQMTISGSPELVEEYEGKVRGTRLRYLYRSYDTPVAPDMIDWTIKKIGKPVKRDREMYERKRGNVRDYVMRVYEM